MGEGKKRWKGLIRGGWEDMNRSGGRLTFAITVIRKFIFNYYQ